MDLQITKVLPRVLPGTIFEEREAFERMASKQEVLNQHQAFVLLKNAFAMPKLQFVLRAQPAYLCREELRIFDRALFDSLGRMANVSLEGDVVKQAGFPVSFGGVGQESRIYRPAFFPCLYELCGRVCGNYSFQN